MALWYDLGYDLVPMMLGAALAPLWVVLVLLILQSPRGLLKAIAFILGVTLTRLVQGLAFGAIAGRLPEAGGGGDLGGLMAGLLLGLGLLLLISAAKTLIHAPDPDAPPPQWMAALDHSGPLTLLGMGMVGTAVAPKLWVFTLSALGVIRGADLGRGAAAIAFLIYMAGAQALMIGPVVLVAIAPRSAGKGLRSASTWLSTHNRPITVGVSLVFGGLFVWKGLSGLLGLG